MNDHIKVNKIDSYTAEEFNISKYDEMVKFSRWLEAQSARFDSARQALKVYRGQQEEALATTSTATDQAPRYKKGQFKSRQQLNNFLRRHGYRWHKVAPMNEHEESRYGECFRWQLYADDGRTLSVEEALAEI